MMQVEESAVRVLVVDDFEPWRDYMHVALRRNPQFKVIGEGADGQEAVRKAQEAQPDLILLDLALPSLNGIAATRAIRECSPKSKVLLMSVERSWDVVREALRSGASGYVVKTDATDDLSLALEAVLQNGQFVSRSLNGHHADEPGDDLETAE